MRYVTLDVYPDEGALHPVERRLAADPDVARRAIHAVEALRDGSFAFLVEVTGDLDRCRTIVAESTEVHEFTVTDDGSGYCYCHVEPAPLCTALLERRRDEAFVLQTPIEYTDDSARRVTVVGRSEQLVGSSLDLPDGYRAELVSSGPYRPDADGTFDVLTDRQREVLATALRLGYYEMPREVTLADVADAVGVEAGTVGKHLRAVESKVLSQYVE